MSPHIRLSASFSGGNGSVRGVEEARIPRSAILHSYNPPLFVKNPLPSISTLPPPPNLIKKAPPLSPLKKNLDPAPTYSDF